MTQRQEEEMRDTEARLHHELSTDEVFNLIQYFI